MGDCLNRFAFDDVLEPIVVDCLSLLKKFVDVVVMFVNRSQNQTAYHWVKIDCMVRSKTWTRFVPQIQKNCDVSAPFL